ncbi:hypothetical protein Mal64_31940 [Pseudobythopirellula maris]|uniref:Uncharacterized protein n=1 Tax=Pseudobythopirellula maris TaxID=2527991 RepID=A0A5C5ZJX0_9BACT|nr:hypothetical protein Mal64_31940 [Pseudobythopirellula maris]
MLLWAGSEIGSCASAATRVSVRASPPKPVFRITPLTHEFHALPGQELRFEFTVEALESDVELEAAAVALVQKPTGVILPAENTGVPSSTSIRFLTDDRVFVRKGESRKVEGRWRLPPDAGGYHTAGITLTDISRGCGCGAPLVDTGVGALVGAEAAPTGEAGTSVKFLTRYLMRMDATVSGGAGREASTPTISAGSLVEHHGRAIATVLLEANDAQGGVWEVAGQIHGERGPIGRPFAMRLPSRSAIRGPEGTKVQMLAGSRVLAMSPVGEPLFTGEYQLEVTLSRGGVAARKQRFDLEVGPNDFPAQRSVVAQVVEAVEASPSQLELSTARGGARLVPLTLTNRSDQTVGVRLAAEGTEGGAPPEDWLTVRPTDFTLRPRSKRQVLVAARGGGDRDRDHYAMLRVEVAPTETTVGGAHRVPVALLSPAESRVEWTSDPLTWRRRTATSGSVELRVHNHGTCRLAPHATLTLTDVVERQVTAEAGFGRWVLPGESATLAFDTPGLPAGAYHAALELTPDSGADVETLEQQLDVD